MITSQHPDNETREWISTLLPQVQQLRHHLHQHPELSGQEYKTAAYLQQFLQPYHPDEIWSGLGTGTGLVTLWDSGQPGFTVLFRAELDALPIEDPANCSYSSTVKGVSHKCGHDGHAAMVAALAPLLQKKNFSGKRGLLFQPAEETGAGAAALVADERFRSIKPDFIFGLHNLPGYPLGQVVLRNDTFCAASRGMKIEIEGQSSHAAEPEKAYSPAACLCTLLDRLPQLPQQLGGQQLILLTVTHACLGEPSFGITPGTAVLQATLRTFEEKDMERLVVAAEYLVQKEAQRHGLQVSVSYEEVFPATVNHAEASMFLEQAAIRTGFETIIQDQPFRWSEDFGHYVTLAKTAFFGLGAGEEVVNLHNPQYDFPDKLLPYGVMMYKELAEVVAVSKGVSGE